MITVGKKFDKNAVYIGRGSPLGNPFIMRTENDRSKVCFQFKEYFIDKIKNNDQIIMTELNRLVKLAKQDDLVLGCFCSPRECHGDTIKEYLEQRLLSENK